MYYQHGTLFVSYTGTGVLIIGQIMLLVDRKTAPTLRGVLVPGYPYQDTFDAARKAPGGVTLPYIDRQGRRCRQLVTRIESLLHFDDDNLPHTVPGTTLKRALVEQEWPGGGDFPAFIRRALAESPPESFDDPLTGARYGVALADLVSAAWAAELFDVKKSTMRDRVRRWRNQISNAA